MLQLQTGDVHLWLAYYDRIVDQRALDDYRMLLTDAEREQMGRFYFEDDRRRYLVTRALVRTALSRYAPIAAADWRFDKNAYGRPAIAEHHGSACEITFNISHTRGLIALALTRRVALGVDVENFVVRDAPIDIANHFFSPGEVAALAVVESEHRQRRFFEYWTFKESYIKARGMGLSLPLDKFTFSYPREDSVELDIDPELGDDARRWLLWQLQPAPDYLLALCIEKQAGVMPRLVVQPALPDLACGAPPLLRSSV